MLSQNFETCFDLKNIVCAEKKTRLPQVLLGLVLFLWKTNERANVFRIGSRYVIYYPSKFSKYTVKKMKSFNLLIIKYCSMLLYRFEQFTAVFLT